MSISSEESGKEDNVTNPQWYKYSSDQYIFSYGRTLDPKFSNPSIAGYYRPWRFLDKRKSGISKILYANSNEFRITVDISQFPPENVSVNVENNLIMIKAHHPVIIDYLGKVSRSFVRKYKTPSDVKLNSMTGKLKRGTLILWGTRELESEKKKYTNVLENDDVN